MDAWILHARLALHWRCRVSSEAEIKEVHHTVTPDLSKLISLSVPQFPLVYSGDRVPYQVS